MGDKRKVVPQIGVITRTVAAPEYDDGEHAATLTIRDPKYVTVADSGYLELREKHDRIKSDLGDSAASDAEYEQVLRQFVEWFVISHDIPHVPAGAPLPERIIAGLIPIAAAPFRPTSLTSISPDAELSADSSSEPQSG